MNDKSLICEHIAHHPDTWEADFKARKVRTKRGVDGRVIFNYEVSADFSDALVREARGIIIDEGSLEVVCWPFTKFGNAHESYADTDCMDWASARVQEKVDGSIVKLYKWKGTWRWATNSCIEASEASVANRDESFADVIAKAVNFGDIEFASLDCDSTYIFELVSPETQVVVAYPEPRLYHIGTRSNSTGEERDEDIGIEKPHLFGVGGNLETWLAEASMMNQGDDVTDEGYVIVDAAWRRIKVKSPKYLELHHALAHDFLKKEDAIDIMLSRDEERLLLVRQFDKMSEMYGFYEKELGEFVERLSAWVDECRGRWEACGEDRKAYALKVKDAPLSAFAFMAIDSEDDAWELARRFGAARVARFLDDWKD